MDRAAELPAAVPGVNEAYLYQYVAIFKWGYNVMLATDEFLWTLLGVRSDTT